jgi:hypothetical protein
MIIHGDGIKWCLENKGKVKAIITGLPDMSEVNMTEEEYIPFLRRASNSVLQAITDEGYAIFIQTDRKCKGLIDKSYYISDEAIRVLGFRMMFHKITLIKDVGHNDKYKPTYSHVLCYTKSGTLGNSNPDVYHRGELTHTIKWRYSIESGRKRRRRVKAFNKNGTGIETMRRCLEYIQTKNIDTIVDPFCGEGTTLIIGREMGFQVIGIDIDEELCELVKNKM